VVTLALTATALSLLAAAVVAASPGRRPGIAPAPATEPS
jgi:hypothetical protein